jgi:uncharacterized membrane protein YsdA (DUF1294 family)
LLSRVAPFPVAALAGVNLALFLVFGLDKALARFGPEHGSPDGRRVPEAVLLGLALLGAAPGGWLAMLLFRHKTQKTRFRLGVPALALVEAAAVAALVWRFPAWFGVRSPG